MPRHLTIKVGSEDIRDLNFIVFEQPDTTILSGHVEGKRMEEFQSQLLVEIKSASDSSKVESVFPLPLSNFFQVKDLPKGKYIVQLRLSIQSSVLKFNSDAIEADLENTSHVHVGPLRYSFEEDHIKQISATDGEAKIFDISPPVASVSVAHQHVTVPQKFKVTGFSVGDRVVDGMMRRLRVLKIIVDGHERCTTNKDGYYKLDQVTSNHNTIEVRKEHYKFSSLKEYMVLLNMASLEDIKSISYDICGTVKLVKSGQKAKSVFPLPLSNSFQVKDLPKDKYIVQLRSSIQSSVLKFNSDAIEADLENTSHVHVGPLRYSFEEDHIKQEWTAASVLPLVAGVSVIALFITIPRLNYLYQTTTGIPAPGFMTTSKREPRKPVTRKKAN